MLIYVVDVAISALKKANDCKSLTELSVKVIIFSCSVAKRNVM